MTLNAIYTPDLIELDDESHQCWADVVSPFDANYSKPCGRITEHRSGLCPEHYAELVPLAQKPLDKPVSTP